MSFADYFERVSIISLPSRQDRRRHVIRELERHGVTLQPGKVEFFDAIRPESADGFESIGRRGVFLSHATIARNALRDGIESTLVLEDDVTFTDAMATHGDWLLRELTQRRWSIAFFGHVGIDAPPEKLAELREGPPAWLKLPGPRIGAHCYALHRDVLPDLVEYMHGVETRPPGHPEGARFGADATYNMFHSIYPQYEQLIARPMLADQFSSASDLTPRWFDRLPLLRHLAATARNLKRGGA